MEHVKLALQFSVLLVMIIGAFVGLRRIKLLHQQVEVLKKQSKDSFEWEKRVSSLKYSGLYYPIVQESKQALQDEFNFYYRKDSIPKKDFVEAINKNPKIQIHINYLLTYYENICLACKKGIVDEDIIFDMCGKTMVNNRKKLLNYIDHHREVANNERLWKEFVEFSLEMEKRLSAPSPKPAPIG